MCCAMETRVTTSRVIALLMVSIGWLVLASLLMPNVASGATKEQEEKAKDEPVRVGEGRYEYSVKFVCGKPQTPVLASGEYFTAINVHNPNDQPIEFKKKIAVALPKQTAGPVSRFFHAKLKSDQALEIDCPDIVERAPKLKDFPEGFREDILKGFLKGFVVIRSHLELDVVAVYTTAEWQVETMHTERVPYRFVGKPETIKAEKVDPEVEQCPPGVLGEPVGNEGCCCNKPMVLPPLGPADWWPDCAPALICAGNLPGPTIPTSTYAVCVERITSVNPQIHWSQPAFCGQL